ncbi:MAG: hypothetical protein HDT28_04965 [Clostridiales bacterium]|nr:hypothetical protein [Clostridiales bacterium]
MKARRISDGKVIEVQSLLVNSLQDVNNPYHCRKFIDTDGKAYDRYEIEIIPDEPQASEPPAIDWEKRRYEIAKELFSERVECTYKSLEDYDFLQMKNPAKFLNDTFENVASSCVQLSDMLIKQLRT